MTAQDERAADSFTHRTVAGLGGRRLHRLGLAGNYGIDAAGFRRALELGPQYIFWTPKQKAVTSGLREALAGARRERYVLATGPTLGFFPGSLRKAVDETRKLLNTDYVDVLQLFWLGKTSAWRPSIVEELVRLREEGLARSIGVSIHDRERAGALAADSPLDLLMIRYNAAHPGAEQDIFPHLARRQPAVLAYTATAWGKLLKAPEGWEGPGFDAGDCYRFCLSDPHVDLVLSGPASLSEVEQNLRALERGPMEGEELARMRRYGASAKANSAQLRWGME